MIMIGRYTHLHRFKRARRPLKFLRTTLTSAARSRATRRRRTFGFHRANFTLEPDCEVIYKADYDGYGLGLSDTFKINGRI